MQELSWLEWNAIGAAAVLLTCLGALVSSLNWNEVRFQPKFFFLFTLIWCALFVQAFAMHQSGVGLPFGISIDAIGVATMPLATFNLSVFVWMVLFPKHFQRLNDRIEGGGNKPLGNGKGRRERGK